MEHRSSIAARDEVTAWRRAGRSLRRWHVARLVLVVVYLLSVAQFYQPGVGFTGLIMFDGDRHEREIPAVRTTPHAHRLSYDGQFYAQMAVEPLLQNLAFDRALDTPPYRARRILFSWTAYVAGLGKPFWVLQAYALQNAVAWLILAWWLHRRVPGTDARSLAVWGGTLFCHGLLMSTNYALLDGPSLLLTVLAMSALERGWTVGGTTLIGVSGLARETNLLALVALPTLWPLSLKRTLTTAGLVLLAVLPLALWIDYLRTIYDNDVLTGSGDLLLGFAGGFIGEWREAIAEVFGRGYFRNPARFSFLAILAVSTQVVWLLWDRDVRDPWWRLAFVFILLMFTLDQPVWEGHPGAYLRVLLPVQLVFNLRLIKARRFWPVFALGNLSLLAGIEVMQIPLIWRWV